MDSALNVTAAAHFRRNVFASFTALGKETEVCVDSDEYIQPFFLCEPPEQVRLFVQLYCMTLALSLVMNTASASRFYRLLERSRVPQQQHRGLGYAACKAYGLVPIPALSKSGLHIVAWMLIASLVLACHTQLAPRFFLFASFGMYFLYFGQLFCDSKHGGHGSLLTPSVILLLALSGGPEGSPWTLVFIKIFVGIVYLSGAVSKLVVSAYFRQRWCGSTMQAYVFDAMWSRPHRLHAVRWLQEFLLTRWWACTALAIGGLAFELGFLPLTLIGGRTGAVLAAFVALGFHIGVDILQGLDFLPFWCPVFWAFLPELQAIWHGLPLTPEDHWTAVLAQGFQEEPCRWIMSAAYVSLQIAAAAFFWDLQEKERLPLTCCPMFALPRNLFGKEMRGGLMMDSDLRNGGHIDFAYNYLPWQAEQYLPLTEEHLRKMPGRVIVWMSTRHCNEFLVKLFKKEYLNQDLLICSNFEVEPELHSKIADTIRFLEEAEPGDWACRQKVSQVLALQAECLALFQKGRPSTTVENDDSLYGVFGEADKATETVVAEVRT